MSSFDECPHCGSPLPRQAHFCPACGASEESGWHEPTAGWADGGYDTDDEGFDYDAFVQREFPDSAQAPRRSVGSLVITVVILITCLMVLWASLF